jgi:chromosome segregation ATPase
LNAAHETYSEARLKDDERVSNALAQADEAEEQFSLAIKQVSRLESDIQHERQTSNLLSEQLAEVRANAINNEKRSLAREDELKKQIERLTGELEAEIKAHKQTLHDRTLENDQLRYDYDECRNQLTTALKNVERLQLENQSQVSELKAKDMAIAQLNNTVQTADAELKELSLEVSSLKQALTAARDEQQSMSTQLSDVISDMEQIHSENQRLRENLASTKGAMDVLKAENERINIDNSETVKSYVFF